jgi:rare lipoprotein A (peptidoglycan hydrolase)
MKKYFLTICTFFLHTSIFNSKSVDAQQKLYKETPKENEVVAKPDEINPTDSTDYVKKGGLHSATWYNPHGAKTASGLKFHKDSLTAAYNFSKMHSYLRVTNVSTNESIIVRVIDRMGYKGSNHIDLSKCAFDSIGNPNSGRIRVIVEEISIKKAE